MRRLPGTSAGVLLVGGVLAAALVARVGTPVADAAILLGSTAAFSMAVALGGRRYLASRGEISLRNHVLTVAVTSVATVVAGTMVAAQLMFISYHDLNALLAVMTVAVAVSVAASFRLAGRFDADARTVTALADHLGESSGEFAAPHGFGIREMHVLAQRLQEVSTALASSHTRERSLEGARRELVAWVSHDLRSPLATIRALAEALEDGIATSEEERTRYYRAILRESERLTALVDDLFELSRIHAGAMPVAPLASGVQELVDDVVTAIVHSARANRVSITCDVAEVGDCLIPATDVTRALRNLLDNAVRHTPAGGEIRVAGWTDGDAVMLSVRDECGGIPQEDLDRVFDTAFRGDAARGRDGSGGGLGLAIARGLVESHAGHLDVRNHDEGCEFRIRLPRRG